MVPGNGLTMIVEIATHKMAETTSPEVTQMEGLSNSYEEVVVWDVVADMTAMAMVEAPGKFSHRI
jgi:hypothetical protein